MRILLIEDDETLCQTIPFRLEREGFSVDTATDGEEGLQIARERLHDLILLDRMLPGLDGLTLLRCLRRERINTPVILLTALGQLSHRTEGLDSGADDYIVKPFAFEELLARIRCVLRRPGEIQDSRSIAFGDLRYEPNTLRLTCKGQTTVLSKRLGDLLELFLRNPGQTLPRQTILLRVWGMDTEVEDGNLDNYTYFLRKSLGKVGSRVRLVTLRGVGYRLEDGHAS